MHDGMYTRGGREVLYDCSTNEKCGQELIGSLFDKHKKVVG